MSQVAGLTRQEICQHLWSWLIRFRTMRRQFLLLINYFICFVRAIRMYVHWRLGWKVSLYGWVYLCTHVHVWRQSFSILFLETKFFTALGVLIGYTVWPVSPRDPSVSTFLGPGLQAHTTKPAFHMDAGDPRSGPQGGTVGSLSTWLSP